jgi:hypothetical protein
MTLNFAHLPPLRLSFDALKWEEKMVITIKSFTSSIIIISMGGDENLFNIEEFLEGENVDDCGVIAI